MPVPVALNRYGALIEQRRRKGGFKTRTPSPALARALVDEDLQRGAA